MTYRQRMNQLDQHNKQMAAFAEKEAKNQERVNGLSEAECYAEGFNLGRGESLDGATAMTDCIIAMDYPYSTAFRQGYYSAF